MIWTLQFVQVKLDAVHVCRIDYSRGVDALGIIARPRDVHVH